MLWKTDNRIELREGLLNSGLEMVFCRGSADFDDKHSFQIVSTYLQVADGHNDVKNGWRGGKRVLDKEKAFKELCLRFFSREDSWQRFSFSEVGMDALMNFFRLDGNRGPNEKYFGVPNMISKEPHRATLSTFFQEYLRLTWVYLEANVMDKSLDAQALCAKLRTLEAHYIAVLAYLDDTEAEEFLLDNIEKMSCGALSKLSSCIMSSRIPLPGAGEFGRRSPTTIQEAWAGGLGVARTLFLLTELKKAKIELQDLEKKCEAERKKSIRT